MVTITNPDGKKVSKEIGFTYYSDGTSSGVFQVDLALTKGINIFSLPLRPETPITASQIAADLGATVVIRAIEGQFQAYVVKGVGTDFQLKAGEGVIVNLLEAKNYSLKGLPWGTPVSAAPSIPVTDTWAFVVAGYIDDPIPKDGKLCITNLRTKESSIVPVSSSGEFTIVYVDMNKRSVIAAGDEIITQIIGMEGIPLTKAQHHRISYDHLSKAYLLIRISAIPKNTQLFQNYPNPFNPETWIPFQLSQDSDVKISIYDISGQLIRRLDLGYRTAGWYISKEQSAYWDGRNELEEMVSSGVYFYNLQVGSYSTQRKLIVLK